MDLEDELRAPEINRALVGTRFGGVVQHWRSVGSTSTLALEAAAAGARTGVWVADEQTAGRGRGGHGWHSAAGDGLYVSALVAPSLSLGDALLLSLATGLAARSAIAEVCGTAPDIRWPNDLLLAAASSANHDGRVRKTGGILVETAAEPGDDPALRFAVIGIGINVHHRAFPPELAELATSLELATGAAVRREALLIALLRGLDAELLNLELAAGAETAVNGLLARFAAASTWARGKRVSVPEDGGYTGTTGGLDQRGFLCVAADDGTARTVRSGGVRELLT